MALDQTAMQFVEEHDQLRKGTWHEEEDERLAYFVQLMGDKKWDSLAKASGLRRSGKSCRLRWLNYLRPNLKHGQISVEEENIILQLQEKWGNKWSKIAERLPGRTDNEIKNYWRSYLRKKVSQEVEESEAIKKAKEESLCNNQNESSPKKLNDNNYHEKLDHLHESSPLYEILGTKWENSSEASTGIALTNSPYENRLSSWISEYSNENEMNYQNDSCVSIESSNSSYLECWTSDVDYYYSNTWDYSSPLWDMD